MWIFLRNIALCYLQQVSVPTRPADSACLDAFCDGTVNHSLVSGVASQLTDPTYEKPLAINGVSLYIRNGKTALIFSEY